MIPMLIIISIIIFSLSKLAPGDAFTGEHDPRITKDIIEKQRELYGLKDPAHIQYLTWLNNILHGNLGVSLRFKQPVAKLIGERIGNTLFLSTVSVLITLIVAIPIGIYSAVKPYSKLDYTATTLGFLGIATPTFFAGLIAIYVFAINLKVLPAQGTISNSDLTGMIYIIDKLKHVILPALTLGLASTAAYMRYMRSEMMEALNKDYIRTAYAKGLPKKVVLFKHALRNALIPIITLLGFEFGYLLSGAVITESIYSWPGMGKLLLDSIGNRDYPIIMAELMIIAVTILIGNLIADILYALVDPRIRYE